MSLGSKGVLVERLMHAICQVALDPATTPAQLTQLAETLQDWCRAIPDSCHCAIADDGLRALRRGEFPTPACRQLATSADSKPALPTEPRPLAVVFHLDADSSDAYQQLIDSLVQILPGDIVVSVDAIQMDCGEDLDG